MPESTAISLEYLPLDDLIKRKNPRNPKRHTQDLDNSIERFGYVNPVTIDERTGLLVSGHGRVDSLAKLQAAGQNAPERIVVKDGVWYVPVVRGVTFLSDGEASAYLLADNRLTEAGGWSEELLATMLAEQRARPDGLRGLGWSAEDVDELLLAVAENAEVENPPAVPDARLDARDELQQKWQVAPNDVWECPSLTVPGNVHRLICGDSLKAATYQTLLGDATVPLLWTDPPWNVSYGEDIADRQPASAGGLGWRKRTILNDNLGAEFPAFLATFCALMKVRVTPGGLVYVVMGGQEWPTVDKALRDTGFHWSSTIVWVKDCFVLGRRDYHTQYEPIWYGWNTADGAGRLHEVKDRTQSDVWQIDRPKKSEAFPIMKPVELVARAIKNSSMMGEDVLDPFLGSGTTAAACEQTGRRFVGCELDPGAMAVCLERLAEMSLEPRRVVAGVA